MLPGPDVIALLPQDADPLIAATIQQVGERAQNQASSKTRGIARLWVDLKDLASETGSEDAQLDDDHPTVMKQEH